MISGRDWSPSTGEQVFFPLIRLCRLCHPSPCQQQAVTIETIMGSYKSVIDYLFIYLLVAGVPENELTPSDQSEFRTQPLRK